MRTLLLIVLVSGYSAVQVQAQSHSLRNAASNYTQGKLEEAKLAIDTAAADSLLSSDPNTWYTRGFIYRDLYRQDKAADTLLSLRLEAVHSFKKLMELDSTEKYSWKRADILKMLKSLAATFHNDAYTALDKGKTEWAQKRFASYKTTIALTADTAIDIKDREIQYYLALASTYTDIYDKNTSDKTNFEKAKQIYRKILDLDPRNLDANFHMGILYYNEAVDIVTNLDFDAEVESMIKVESETMVLFKQSLPFMKAAYQLDPTDKSTLKGLSGIYYGLNDFDKFDEYQKKLKELK